MIHAYDKIYLEKARVTLARMLDYAVYDLQYDMTEFFELFLRSGVAGRFERGETSIVAGRSGVELAYEVMGQVEQRLCSPKPRYTVNRSREYWTGWALAYYQWETGLTFAEIIEHIPINEIRNMYSPYHEMDIRQFVEHMNEKYHFAQPDTNLKRYRQRLNLSQRELADFSGVSVRTIQQYEQRQKNINKAQAETLIILAQVLNCQVNDLIERVQPEGTKDVEKN